MIDTVPTRRVVLLETDERAGLVAELAVVCKAAGISLEITTGPAHVLLTFAADEQTLDDLRPSLESVHGVQRVHVYQVLPVRAAPIQTPRPNNGEPEGGAWQEVGARRAMPVHRPDS